MADQVYRWKVNVYPVPAQVAGAALMDIEENEGRVDPARVVELSADEDAPLHGCFEWDDSVAATAHRRTQAREIIRNIQIVRETDDGEESPVRAFWSTERAEDEDDSPRYAYRSLDVVINSDQHRNYILEQALRELQAFSFKYRNLEELAGVFAEVEKVKQLTIDTDVIADRVNEEVTAMA